MHFLLITHFKSTQVSFFFSDFRFTFASTKISAYMCGIIKYCLFSLSYTDFKRNCIIPSREMWNKAEFWIMDYHPEMDKILNNELSIQDVAANKIKLVD